ncbi:MAG: hypothetical protein ACE5FD_12925, partial [Anaerolineae bacterium]
VVLDPVYKDWAISQGLNTPPVEICTACGGTQLVDTYKIEILAPRANSRFFLDPEMPENATSLTLNCRIEPSTKDVLWLVNDKEYKVVPFPYRLNWRMTPGKYVFQAMVPFTACKSKAVAVEVY